MSQPIYSLCIIQHAHIPINKNLLHQLILCLQTVTMTEYWSRISFLPICKEIIIHIWEEKLTSGSGLFSWSTHLYTHFCRSTILRFSLRGAELSHCEHGLFPDLFTKQAKSCSSWNITEWRLAFKRHLVRVRHSSCEFVCSYKVFQAVVLVFPPSTTP